MSIREDIERMECETLSPYATLSIHSRGRDDPEEQCDIRPVFQRDRDRILHCNAFRRLKNKTQVFLSTQRGSLQNQAFPYIRGVTECAHDRKGTAAQ